MGIQTIKNLKTLNLLILIYLFKTSYCGDHTYTFGEKKFSQTKFEPDAGTGPKFSIPNGSNDPVFVEQGIYFSSSTYLIQNESFAYTGSEFSIEIWVNIFNKGIQSIYSTEIQGIPNIILRLQSWDFGAINSFICYIHPDQRVQGMPTKWGKNNTNRTYYIGWNKLGCKFSNGVLAAYTSSKLTTTLGTHVASHVIANNMKLGCFGTCNTDYIIYSLKFKDGPDLGNFGNTFSVINPYNTCGDNSIQAVSIEQCDDGNYVNGDGCNEACLNESGTCVSNPLSCLTLLLPEVCGDSKMTISEDCDDGNINDGDGCDRSCKVEDNWLCSGGSETTPSTCKSCELEHCQKCQTPTHLECAECETEYKRDKNNLCVHSSVFLMSESAQQIASATSAVSAVGGVASIIVSVLNVAFPAALWAIMNQMQLLQLLLLIKGFIPDDAKGMLLGNIELLFDISFISPKKIPYFDTLATSITFKQTNLELIPIGFESGNSILNCINVIFTYFLLFCFNSVSCCLPRFKLEEDSNRCKKVLNFGVKKLIECFTFTFYIRTMMESNQFLLLANLSNVNEFDTSSTAKLVALVFSIFVLSCSAIFIFFAFYTFYVSYNAEPSPSRLKCEEFLGGIKALNIARLYSFLSLTRRLAMVALLICGEELGHQIVAIGLIVILIPYLIYIIFVKPFKEVSNNIIEIINEIFITLMTTWLCYFNREQDWRDSVTSTFIFIITSNTLIVTGIIIICFIIKIAKYFATKCCKKKKVTTKVTLIKVNSPQVNQSQIDQSQVNQSQVNQSKVKQPQIDHSQFYYSEFDHSEFDHSEFDHHRVDNSDNIPGASLNTSAVRSHCIMNLKSKKLIRKFRISEKINEDC